MAKFMESAGSIKKSVNNKKKKKDQETPQKKAQSPSVSKNSARTQQAQNQKSYGGSQKPVKKPSASYTQRNNQRTQQAQNQKTFGEPIQRRTQQSAANPQQRRTNTESNSLLNRRRAQDNVRPRQAEPTRRIDHTTSANEMLKARQAQKSGVQNDINDSIQERRNQRRIEAQKIKSGQYERKNTAVDKWDRDIADTVTHTLKQTAAEDKAFANTALRGITLKDRQQFATDEQIRKADEKYEKRKSKYAAEIEKEGQELEDIKKGHSYLGQQALSAVSSTTGMMADIAVGTLTGTGQAGTLSHMFARSSAGAQGQVKKQATALRQKLKESGNYSDEELDEMFRNVDAMDELNALASGGIEVASELLFPGYGIARKAIGGKGMSIAEKAAGKLLKNAGGKASSGLLRNMFKGTAEEIAEEEIGGPAQAFAANLIYGNKFQEYNEDAVKRSLKAQSDELRSQIQSDDDARQVATRLGSSSFLNESKQAYLDSGLTEEQATRLAEMSRDYLSASLSGDIDKAKATQDEMVKALSGGENSLKEKFTFRDALDAAVSTTMMTMGTGAIGAMNSANVGRAFKGTAGMDAVRQQAEIIRNWGDTEESSKAQAVMDRIDAGEDVSDTQVYELIQGAAEAAEKGYQDEDASRGTAAREMKKRDLRISPIQQDGTLAPQTQRRYDEIVTQTVSRYSSLARLGQISEMDAADIELGADIGAAMQTGVITAEQINELARGSATTRTVFQDVTGINLAQFNVNDRNGNLDISETNNNMRQSLMAEAAYNMVNSARLEQVAWNSEARGAVSENIARTVSKNSNLKKGYASTIEALQSVDPRDRDQFMLMGSAAENIYEYAYNTQGTWDDVKGTYKQMYPSLSMSALKGIYDSAKMDKAEAETPFLNAKVKAGESMDSLAKGKAKAVVRGKFENTTPLVIARDGVYGRELTDDEQLVCVSLAEHFNANITMIDAQDERLKYTTPEGKEAYSNAVVNLKDGEIFIGNATDIGKIVHEVTHMGARLASDKYLDMAHYIMDKAYKFAPERTKAMVEAYKRTYAGQNLTDAQIEEELVSDLVAVFSDDEVFVREISQEQPSLAKRIYNAICDVLRSLRNILATGRIQDPAVQESFLTEIGAYEEARQLWLKMMHEAAKNNALIGLAEWEENSFRDTRESRMVSNDVLANRDDTAIFIKNTADADYIDMIFNGEKTEETRNTRTLDKFIGKEVAVTDGKMVYGTVVLGEPHKYSAEEFRSDEAQNKHRVPMGDTYDSANGKWAYPIESYERYDEPKKLSDSKDYMGSRQARQIRYSITPEQQETIQREVGPDIRFSAPTWRNELAKAVFNSSEGFSAYDGKKSGRQITYDLTKNNFSEEQAKAVTDYMDMMAAWFEKTGAGSLRAKYKFVGWDDLTKAEVQVRKNDKGEIVSLTVSAMVKNGEYPVNFDLTTVCNKREGFSEVVKNLIDTKVPGTNENVLNTIKLTDKNMWKINQALKAEGIDTACLGCFVEARRYYAQNFMNKIDDKWNSAVRKARRELGLPEEEYFNFSKGKEVSGEEWSAIDELWSAYDDSSESKSSPADRIKILMDEIVKNKEVDSPYLKLIQMSDISTPEGYNAFKQLSTKGHDMVKTIKSIYGTSAPKEILAFTPYNSEIALLPENMKGMDTGEYLKSIGGIRVQSFSDFKIEHVFEHFQMVADEAARKFVTHGYSKVIAFPRIFGLTGRKINMSVMFDVLPNKAWAQALGISVRKAAKYAKKYQGLQFVKEMPAENPDNRPYIETEIEGVHGYLTYLVSDADYVNSVRDREYQKNLDAGMPEDEARRKANEAKPFEQSINYKDAVALENQEGYKENIGIIAVAYGDEHLKVLMSDPNVRYIIPYHKSGLPTFISKKTSLAIARDYTNFQNTNIAETWKDANGKEIDFRKEFNKFVKDHKDEKYPAIEFFKQINDNKYKVKFGSKTSSQKSEMAGTADFDVYKDLDSVKDIREVSNAYLEHCIKNGWCPVFHEFAGDPNYYKMIFDFAVTDGTTTNIYPQRAVRNNYPGLDIDAKVAAGEEITEEDLAKLKEAVEIGAKEQNDKNMIRANNMGNVMNDLLSRDTENSIIADTNLQSIRWGTPDYTDVKLGNEEMTPEETDADIRQSIEVNLDDDYMDAYFDGDDDAMQDLVNMAAERAGYKYKAYHHTENAFTVFDRSKARRTMDIQGFYFSADPEAEREYGSVRYDVFLKINNPYVVDSSDKMNALPFEYGTEDAGVKAREWLQENGYDAVIRDAEYYGAEADEIIVFEPEQIKSSEPMLFEDDPNGEYGEGDIIPLSQRFDPTNPDIRYSLPTQDADGNVLSDGQMEYFKYSQARDDQGRLVPVYHTTNKGGFTIFDPMESDDHRSLFFSSDLDVSLTYANDSAEALDFAPKDLRSWDDLIKYGRQLFNDSDMSWDDDVDENNLEWELYDKTSGDWADIDYDEWLSLVENNDPRVDDYRVKISLPYSNEDGETESVSFEGDSVEDLLSKVSNGGVPHAGYYQVYLNLENPMVIDAQGQNWDSIALESSVPNDMHLDLYSPEYLDEWANREDELYKAGQAHRDGTQSRTHAEAAKENDSYVLKTERGDFLYVPTDEDEMGEVINEYYGLDLDSIIGITAASYLTTLSGDFDRLGRAWANASIVKDYVDEGGMDTRAWAAQAQAEGYDGLIIRNVVDIGGESDFSGDELESDIYVAFSSNQVKDMRNQNPSENPDIRYSKTDPDEAMSRMAHDYAYDTSHEALEYYESIIDDLSDSETSKAYNKAKKMENVDKFYAGLQWYADGMKFDDPILEEGRERMASSKADFFSRNNAKWNPTWLTEGRVLDDKSVRKPVRELVMNIMAHADANRKYKTDVVNKTIVDVRLAYDYAKQGRTEIADALLWHSALRMIENVDFIDDEVWNNYKDLRDYLRTTRISLGEEYWADVEYQKFRKDNFGKINLVSGDTNVDTVYKEMCELWPEFFKEDEYQTPPEQLARIEQVLNSIQPYRIAYSSEDAAEMAFDIAAELFDIMENGTELKSFADKAKERTAEAVAAERARAEERAAIKQEKFDHDVQKLKARHMEAMREARAKARESEKKKASAKFKEYKAKQRENKYHKKYFDSIKKSYDTLVDRLRTNTKDKHIPEQYKRELAALLAAFDFQTVRSKKLQMKKGPDGYERLDMSQKTIKMHLIQSALKKIEADTPLFNVNDAITDIMVELTGMYENGYREDYNIDGKTLDELNSQQLKQIDKLLKALIHEFNNYENVRAGNRKQKAADIGGAQIETSLAHAEKYGKGSDYYGIRGAIDKLINLDEVTPAYLFRQIDPEGTGLGLMFKELRSSFDKYVRNQAQLNEWMDEIVGDYHDKGFFKKYGSGELEKWRSENYAQTIELESGKSVTLTPAQMMSIHCLAKRTQAYNHMTGDGIVVKPVSFQAKLISDLKKRADYSLPVKLTDTDIRNIELRLTDDQKAVADKLQQLMATKMAAWGNEASMAVIGINLFEDPDYFPIKSDRAALEEDFTAEQFAEMIRSFGFTKAVAPNAKNAIAIDDIFDVVTEHCNNMNLYNAYSESMNDFQKVYNYKQAGPDSVYSVKQAVAHGHSKKATTYISTFLQDLNGNVSRGRDTGIDQMMQDALGKAKKASVFANGRVALQQPTAIVRAFAVIDPKYLKGIKAINSKEAMQEMFDHCPIALWKSWGYYDINMGKSIEDLIMNNGSMAEDVMTDIYGKLDNKTWSVIWQMVKNEVRETNPELKENTDEFYDKCNERMTEVVDLTQVVDSPFHRSHAMRDKSVFTKMFTAFMAEPTLTFNMVRDGLMRSVEAHKDGNKAESAKIMGRTASVFVLQAAAVSAAAAIWDAVRRKKPDKDDDDDRLLHLWWVNCVENFKDNLNLFNNIYYVKDIMSIFQGWDQKNLGLQGFVHLRDAYNQLTGNKKVSSKLSWLENALSGIGYLTGVPFKTLINDTNAIWEWIGWKPGVVEFAENWAESVQDMNGGEAKGNGFGATKSTDESEKKSSGKATLREGKEVKSWTYENAPIHIKDGSLVDNFLNSMGYNLTASEINAIEEEKKEAEKQEKINSIIEKTESLSGETKDKKVWSYVTTWMKAQNEDIPLSEVIQSGDYEKIDEYREMYIAAGGNTDYFDQRIFDTSKTALKKTIHADATDSEIEQQNHIKDYLLSHGMAETELSEIAYKSYTARDLKAAIMLNDADAAVTELRALLQAGMTDQDFYRLWENRRRFNIMNYKKDGKYKDRLKSTGVYEWAISGTLTSTFGGRKSPGGIGSTNHKGIDIAGSTGDPVHASDGGVVIMAQYYGGYGKTVQIQHDDGTITQYSHLSWWDAQVGDTVAQGQVIGKVGSTGNSKGPHLHFGIIKNGSYVDPMKYLQGAS